ncbi:MAG: hypothetical protein GKR94_19000 [Gammaproteobacteria bacterium]|nr:hypothetical protein [Gammaproteobacteria bacterium]
MKVNDDTLLSHKLLHEIRIKTSFNINGITASLHNNSVFSQWLKPISGHEDLSIGVRALDDPNKALAALDDRLTIK